MAERRLAALWAVRRVQQPPASEPGDRAPALLLEGAGPLHLAHPGPALGDGGPGRSCRHPMRALAGPGGAELPHAHAELRCELTGVALVEAEGRQPQAGVAQAHRNSACGGSF